MVGDSPRTMQLQERAPGPGTLGRYCEEKLSAICDRTSFAPQRAEILSIYRDLSSSWSSRPLDARPSWSGLTCDLTPFEMCIGMNRAGKQELGFIVEPQGEPPRPDTYWAQTRALFTVLASRWAVDLSRLRRIEDLVHPQIGPRPSESEGGSCTGYGVLFSGSQRRFKFWFNPDCKGVAQTEALCHEVMHRLGVADAWLWTREQLPETASLLVGLELSGASQGRVTVYVRVQDPDVAKLERVAALSDRYVEGEIQDFWESLRWSHFPVMRPHLLELHLIESAPRPVSCSLQFTTFPLLPNDALARRCIRASLAHYGISRHFYDEVLGSLTAGGDLEEETLVHSWVTYRRDEHGEPRLGVYFPGRAYLRTFGALGMSRRTQWPYPDA